MIQSILQAMPVYRMQTAKFPNVVLDKMGKICNKFFWGSNDQEKKIHWANWDKLCKPIEGGIAIRKMGQVNRVFAMKLWWNFLK